VRQLVHGKLFERRSFGLGVRYGEMLEGERTELCGLRYRHYLERQTIRVDPYASHKRTHAFQIKERSALDSTSEQCSWLSLAIAFGLLFAWGVMSVVHVHDRRLAEANESFKGTFRLVARLDVVVDALDHLAVDQQAFLSTGDQSFQDEVVTSILTLQLNINALDSLAVKDCALPVELSRSIKQIISAVGDSDGIRAARGKAAAINFFASKEDDVFRAKWQADHLRIEIIRSIVDRFWRARASSPLLEALLDDARRWQHLAFSYSPSPPERAGTARHIGSHS
jgi:hypothetical protein